MISRKYIIDYNSSFEEGGSCQFYPIQNSFLGFKEFYSKKNARKAYIIQQKLSKFDLAPKIYSSLCRVPAVLNDQNPTLTSGWGYITETATVTDDIPLRYIQQLVTKIYKKTNLEFWDCHYYNIGWVKRKNNRKLVCIDTGSESFSESINAWGNLKPGPQCHYCLKYKCKCEV